MPPAERREYSGIAPPTTLSAGIANNSTSISITNPTGWPTGAVGPFFAVIDRGLPTEEKVKFSARAAGVLTVAVSGRGVDGTGAASHNGGATIEHVVTADDMNLTNQHAADITLDQHTQYLTTGRHDVTARHPLASLDFDSSRLLAPGDLKLGLQAADHTGWLLCDGRTVAIATYPALWAAMGSLHIWGTDPGGGGFRLPDFRGRAPIGAGPGVGLTNRTPATAFGAETVTLATAHMPSHSHTINDHSHSGTSSDQSTGHWHGLGGHVHGGDQHDHNIQHWHPAHIGERGWAQGGHDHYAGVGTVAEGTRASGGSVGSGGTSPINVEAAANGAPNGLNRSGWVQNGGNTGGPSGGSDQSDRGHTHTMTTGGASNRGTDAQGSGTAVGIMNPHLAVNIFVKT